MYAIVKTGGKQYTVREKDVIQVEKLDVPAGEKVMLKDVLFVSGDKGEMIGTPLVEGATVSGKVVAHGLGKKIIGFTYKPKKNERRRYGHRQPYTQVLIEKIAVKKKRERKATEETSE
ncbi:MAG TPA: 50S ribosomal protein L21 [Armatimonadota bacterium]|nr:50S ribosomal protein L21 [Armatimonadota bacterium]